MTSEFISVNEAAAISGLSVDIIRRRARNGEIEGLKKLSGVYLIPREWAINNRKKPQATDMAKELGISRQTYYKRLRKDDGTMEKQQAVAYAFGRLYAVAEEMSGGARGVTKLRDNYGRFPGYHMPELIKAMFAAGRELKEKNPAKYERLDRRVGEIMNDFTPEDLGLRLGLELQSALTLGEQHEREKLTAEK